LLTESTESKLVLVLHAGVLVLDPRLSLDVLTLLAEEAEESFRGRFSMNESAARFRSRPGGSSPGNAVRGIGHLRMLSSVLLTNSAADGSVIGYRSGGLAK
jgi:hypothetical protein